MLDDADDVVDALAGTVLARRPVVEIPMVGWDEVAFAIECDPHEVTAAWEAARSVLAATGRWPLAVWEWDGHTGPGWLQRAAEERFRRLAMQAELRYATGDHTLGRSDFVITVPDPAVALADRLSALSRDTYDLAVLPTVVAGTGHTPAEVVARFGEHPSRHAVERWLLGDDPAPPGPAPHLVWFHPRHPVLLLLPVANGWDTLVHFTFDGQGGALGAVGRLIAVVRSWHERFGAELVANRGTVLHFAVARPPQTAEEAWTLALEQEAVAPCTTQLPGVPLHHHARALLGRRTWLLHQRP